MRVRMLNDPEVIERINRDFVAVSVNVTDLGLPASLPGLSIWRRTFEETPWAHFQFGSFAILDPLGEYALGYADCQIRAADRGGYYGEGREALSVAVDRHRKLKAIRERLEDSEEARRALADFEQELLREVQVRLACAFDSRLLTARFLLHTRLPLMLEALSLGETGVPKKADLRTYKLAVHALGEFVASRKGFSAESKLHLDAIRARLEQVRGEESKGVFVPREADGELEGMTKELARRSALALSRLVGTSWSPEDPKLVETAKVWWESHREDPRYKL